MPSVERPAPASDNIEGQRERLRAAIVAAVIVGIAARVTFGFLYWTGKPLTLDEQEYLLLARSLASGRGYSYGASMSTVRHFERPPIYPLFIAGIFRLTGNVAAPPGGDTGVPASVKITQSLLGIAIIWLIACIARRAAGPGAAVLAAWLAALYPPLVWICAYALNEVLYAVLALLAVWLLDKAIHQADRECRWAVFSAGVAAGLAVLTKEAMVFFLVLAGTWLLIRRRSMLAALLLAGALVVLLPWVGRNYLVHGRFVLGAAHGGITFWTGNNPLASGEGDMAANPDLRRAAVAFEEQHQGLSAQELDSLYYREALGYIVRHPAWYVALEAKKLFHTFVPIGRSYRLHSNLYFIASVVSYLALLPFALAGLAILARRADQPRALWLMAGSAVVVSLVFFPQERFRIPIIDPTLIVCAGAALAGPVETWVTSLRGGRA